jgi:hypothetical protein
MIRIEPMSTDGQPESLPHLGRFLLRRFCCRLWQATYRFLRRGRGGGRKGNDLVRLAVGHCHGRNTISENMRHSYSSSGQTTLQWMPKRFRLTVIRLTRVGLLLLFWPLLFRDIVGMSLSPTSLCFLPFCFFPSPFFHFFLFISLFSCLRLLFLTFSLYLFYYIPVHPSFFNSLYRLLSFFRISVSSCIITSSHRWRDWGDT